MQSAAHHRASDDDPSVNPPQLRLRAQHPAAGGARQPVGLYRENTAKFHARAMRVVARWKSAPMRAGERCVNRASQPREPTATGFSFDPALIEQATPDEIH